MSNYINDPPKSVPKDWHRCPIALTEMWTPFSYKDDIDKGKHAILKGECKTLESNLKKGVYPKTREGHKEGCRCRDCVMFADVNRLQLAKSVREAGSRLKQHSAESRRQYSELVHETCTPDQKKIYNKCNAERHAMGGGKMDPENKEHRDLLVKQVAKKMCVGLPVDTPWDEDYVEEAIEFFGWSVIIWPTAW